MPAPAQRNFSVVGLIEFFRYPYSVILPYDPIFLTDNSFGLICLADIFVAYLVAP